MELSCLQLDTLARCHQNLGCRVCPDFASTLDPKPLHLFRMQARAQPSAGLELLAALAEEADALGLLPAESRAHGLLQLC